MSSDAKDIKREVEMKLANEFGNYMENLGVKHLFGRIWGLLMAQNQPISLKDIAEKLEVSKSAVSTTIKIGLDLGLIQRSYNPKMPREYFFSLNVLAMDMIVDPGLKKLNIFNSKIKDSRKHLLEYGDIIDDDPELRSLKETLEWLEETFRIIYDEYIIFGERVKDKIKKIKEKNRINNQ